MRRSAAAATTSGILPSRQPRSARTQQRILAAAEALLLEQGLEHTTLEQIAERAHVSIGAFYKRFRGKSSLLPALIERVQAQQLQRVRQFIARPDRADSGLGQRIDTLASMFVEAQLEHQRLFRALVAYQLPRPGPATPSTIALLDLFHSWLAELQDQVIHPQSEQALALGLVTMLQTLQHAVLFGRRPGGMDLPELQRESARMLKRYLGLPDNPGNAADYVAVMLTPPPAELS